MLLSYQWSPAGDIVTNHRNLHQGLAPSQDLLPSSYEIHLTKHFLLTASFLIFRRILCRSLTVIYACPVSIIYSCNTFTLHLASTWTLLLMCRSLPIVFALDIAYAMPPVLGDYDTHCAVRPPTCLCLSVS